MRKTFVLFLFVVLLMIPIVLVNQARGQGLLWVYISLRQSTINANSGETVSDLVFLTNADNTRSHSVQLVLSPPNTPWLSQAYFTPNPVNLSPGETTTSTLTLVIADVCNGQFIGPFSATFEIRAMESGVTQGYATLDVNIAVKGGPLSIGISPSQPAYRVGDTISLSMTSNIAVPYTLTVKNPSGQVWSTTSGTLPATFTRTATDPQGTYTATLTAQYCGPAYDSTTFAVRPATIEADISLTTTTVNVNMGDSVTDAITITDNDPTDTDSYMLALSPADRWLSQVSFSPNPVQIPAGTGATGMSTLTFSVPNTCAGWASPGPYTISFIVEATQGGKLVGSAQLNVNIHPSDPLQKISVLPTKNAYILGDTAVLTMSSNVPAPYTLNIKAPDGTQWATAAGTLPASQFTKTTTTPLGLYTTELTVTYCGTAFDDVAFEVVPNTYKITVTLSGLPSGSSTPLLVDNEKVADMKGGDTQMLTYSVGTLHKFQVAGYVNDTDTRHYCAENTWSAQKDDSHTFTYTTQYYLSVSTDPTGITTTIGSDWYAVGASASIAPAQKEITGDTPGTKHEFTTWTVDNAPRSDNGFNIQMNAPHKVVAKYDTYYLLTLNTPYGDTSGAGWQKAGKTAYFSINTQIGFGVQQVFVGWTGDYTGDEPQGSVVMSGPKTISAAWQTSYNQLGLIAAVLIIMAFFIAMVLRSRKTKDTPRHERTEHVRDILEGRA